MTDLSAPNKYDPAAVVHSSLSGGDDECDEDEDDECGGDEDDTHAFDHPSTYVEQPWIWIPRDPLGLSQVLVEELKEAGVYASDLGAAMDRKGVVEVSQNPPDEECDDQ
jgi:hypothetical protein